ncbi:MAG: hypothetical protein AAF892_11825, partial [Cyanobacteria bacterium P01_D01_bin.71]
MPLLALLSVIKRAIAFSPGSPPPIVDARLIERLSMQILCSNVAEQMPFNQAPLVQQTFSSSYARLKSYLEAKRVMGLEPTTFSLGSFIILNTLVQNYALSVRDFSCYTLLEAVLHMSENGLDWEESKSPYRCQSIV